MKTKPRYLTKSRFKLALDCPTKLYYTRNPKYENASEMDSFLQGLAQGGFQVEELARMYYPNGKAILGEDWNYDNLAERTATLLQQEDVTIFEAAFLIYGLFIRVDILEKKGNNIKLIEVKAKSIDSTSHEIFLKSNGSLSGWDSYLYDVAFQQYVINRCYPDWKVKSYLNLVDKSKQTTVNGLHSHFKIVPNTDLRTGVAVTPGLQREDLGASILALIPIEEEIEFIHTANPHDPERTFEEMIIYFKEHYETNTKIHTRIGGKCKGCEFKNNDPEPGQESGFHECWMEELPKLRPDLSPLSRKRINDPKTYDVWNNPASKALAEHRFFMDELTQADVKNNPGVNGMSRSDRQWTQIEQTITKDTTITVDIENLRQEMSEWRYPLNFIDFETCAVAIPFTAGMHPYEQLAFQFSHHIVYEDGRIEHKSEYINLEIGAFPNFDFLRALKNSLEQNDGSIFRYHNHENTIVNVIYNQLIHSNEPDKEELFAFVESIAHPTSSSLRRYEPGARDMIDLQRTVVRNYYHPQTGGSNSIKAILPAILDSSDFLKAKYTQPIKDINLTSLNFKEEYVFLTLDDGIPVNPYTVLPPLFEGISNEALEDAIDNARGEVRQIADGGAALFAYAHLQDTTVSNLERSETRAGLLRYCELDTLAMVMIYEHFKELCDA